MKAYLLSEWMYEWIFIKTTTLPSFISLSLFQSRDHYAQNRSLSYHSRASWMGHETFWEGFMQWFKKMHELFLCLPGKEK